MQRPIFVAALLLAVVSSSASFAFEPNEHTTLSNLALRTAIAARGQTEADYPEIRSLLALDPLRSFGAITALADYTNGVTDILNDPRRPSGLPQSEQDLDWSHAEELRKDTFGFLQALHANSGHFQDAALTTYWHLHDRAKSLAAGNELFAALAIEAYADHFLQDFYAPGHVVTPRTELVGFASLALHDQANRRGLPFRFEEGAAEMLGPLVAALQRVLATLPAADPKQAGFALAPEDFEELGKALAPGAPPLELFGDGRLQRHRAQAAFLVLATADSIAEVLESRARRAPQVDRNVFCFFEGVVLREEMPTICGQPLTPIAPTAGGAGARDSTAPSKPYTLVRVARTRFGQFDLGRRLPDLFQIVPFDLLFLSGFGNWAPQGGMEGGSGGVRIEGLVSAITPRAVTRSLPSGAARKAGFFGFVPRLSQVTLLGYSHRRDEGLTANGAHIRYLFPLRGIDIHGYLLYGRERVQALGRGSWRETGGLGVEVGYGLVYFHLGYESVAGLTQSGKLEPRGTIGFGFTVMVPRSLF